MKTLACILLMLIVSSYSFAKETVTDELCVEKIVETINYIEKNKSFLFQIKTSREGFVKKLSRINASLKISSDYMIKCMSLHHIQYTRAALETPYYPIMVSLNRVYSRLHYIERNPKSAKNLIDRFFQEELNKLESDLNQGAKNPPNKSLSSDAARGAG